MSTYEAGSVCEDCLNFGQQNCLKPFYINLEEQIIKCESSSCMFPYLRRSSCTPFAKAKQSESELSLDEFIEESAKQIDAEPTESPVQFSIREVKENKLENVTETPIMFDFSSLFTNKEEEDEKEEQTNAPSLDVTGNSFKIENLQIKDDLTVAAPQVFEPPKARISRCLANVKSSLNKSYSKKSKVKRRKAEPALVIEPESGKAMRPLDLIKHYMKKTAARVL